MSKKFVVQKISIKLTAVLFTCIAVVLVSACDFTAFQESENTETHSDYAETKFTENHNKSKETEIYNTKEHELKTNTLNASDVVEVYDGNFHLNLINDMLDLLFQDMSFHAQQQAIRDAQHAHDQAQRIHQQMHDQAVRDAQFAHEQAQWAAQQAQNQVFFP